MNKSWSLWFVFYILKCLFHFQWRRVDLRLELFVKCESCQQSCIGLQPIIFLSKQESQLAFYPDLPYETFMEHERNGFELILHPDYSRPMGIVLIFHIWFYTLVSSKPTMIVLVFHYLILHPDFLKPKIRVSLFYEKKDWLEGSDPARALRALGLLLADGAPTVGGGKTFWAVSRIFLRKQL